MDRIRQMAVEEFITFTKENSTYTIGEVLYAILKNSNKKTFTARDLMDIENKEYYTLISLARELEKED